MSIDEPNNYRYARDTLNAYPSFFGTRYEPKYDSSYDGHGPAFVTIASIPIGLIQRAFPNVFAPDLWHFSYFITFQLTGLCLFCLTKRWFSRWTAWGILILFGTQPLLLGHSFINPKDIPFMFLFTLSVLLGFRLVDSTEANESFVSLKRPAQSLIKKFHEADPRRKRAFLTFLGLSLAIALMIMIFSGQINAWLEQIVAFFYGAEPNSWTGRLFDSVASHNIPAKDYMTKALRLFHRAERRVLAMGVLFFLVYFVLLINNITLATFLRNTWQQRYKVTETIQDLVKSLREFLGADSLKIWFADIFRALRNPRLIFAGIALGLATAVRAIAPLAGLIVILYLFVKIRSRGWPVAIAYFFVAGIMTYLTWPRLWDAPIHRYLEGLGMISNFSNFPGRVLFNGQLYGPGVLPRSYLPTLLNIQFTEPVILALYLGMAVLARKLLRDRLPTDLLLYIGLGFAFPLLGLMLLKSPLYHNFRQVLFLIPAMFMLAAFALEMIFSKFSQNWIRVLLIVAIVLPGIYSSFKLYPYEYVYYNSLVGGPAGVRNRYELDYWRISLREVALELNKFAPHGAKIVVTRSAGLFAKYARNDLIVDQILNNNFDLNGEYDYAVQLLSWQPWEIYPKAKNVVLIERVGAVLATAKAVKGASVK